MRVLILLLVAVYIYKKDMTFIIVSLSNVPEFIINYNLINLENIIKI